MRYFLFGQPTNYYPAERGLTLLIRRDSLLSLWDSIKFLSSLKSQLAKKETKFPSSHLNLSLNLSIFYRQNKQLMG